MLPKEEYPPGIHRISNLQFHVSFAICFYLSFLTIPSNSTCCFPPDDQAFLTVSQDPYHLCACMQISKRYHLDSLLTLLTLKVASFEFSSGFFTEFPFRIRKCVASRISMGSINT